LLIATRLLLNGQRVKSTHKACSELPLDKRLRGAILVANMPYNIAYVLQDNIRLPVDKTADFPRMISDFFYPQPGGVESHIYQLSSVGDLLFDHSTSNHLYNQNQQQLTSTRN
jgi:hypothetical protein